MRSCGDCNACCIAPSIAEIAKPAFSPCHNLCGGNEGCSRYEDRPKDCRTFNCSWRNTPVLPNKFRPDRCGLVLATRARDRLTVWELGAEWEGSELSRLVRMLGDYEVEVISVESSTEQ